MGANNPIEDAEATLLAATKSALDELVWWAHAAMAAKAAEASSRPTKIGAEDGAAVTWKGLLGST
jgi:hypothetical protein